MLRFLRRLWAWILRLMGRSPRVTASAAAPERQVKDLDYEGCLFALIEQVEAGGSRASLQAVLIRRRISAAQLADWLATFSQRWMEQVEDYQALAGQLQQLGEIVVPPLGSTATRISQQLQVDRNKSMEVVNLSIMKTTTSVDQSDTSLDMQKFEKTLEAPESYVEQHPDDAATWYEHGNSLYHLGCYQQAIESYEQAIENYEQVVTRTEDAAHLVNCGVSLHELGHYEQAIENYDRAIALQPEYAAMVLCNRGISLDKIGHYEQAVESYDQAIELQPEDAAIWINRGISLDKLGHYERAVKSYDQATKLRPEGAAPESAATIWINRSILLHELGHYEQVVENYDRAITLQPNNASTWINRGISLHELGHYEQAVESYDRAITFQPDNASTWINRGISLHELGHYEQAVESYDRAITLQPDNASTWINRGISLRTLGHYEQAVESYDQAIILRPDDAGTWKNRGISLRKLGHYEQAIESYDQAIILRPDDADTWKNRGISLRKLGCYEQAIESYDQAITLQPDNSSVWNNRGVSLHQLGRYEQAVESYDQAIILRPDNGSAWRNRGLSAYLLKEDLDSPKFIIHLCLSLAQSKQQLLRKWQSPTPDSLIQSLEHSSAISAESLKERFPKIAGTFTCSLPSTTRKFLQQSSRLEPLYTFLSKPISKALIQQLEHDERKHPHHTNSDLKQCGYHGAISSYQASIDKAIRKDTHPENWAKLHQTIGKAHLREAKQRSNPRSLWQKAENSFKAALSSPNIASNSPTFYLQLLESLIDLSVYHSRRTCKSAKDLQRQRSRPHHQTAK